MDMPMDTMETTSHTKLRPYLSPLHTWALAFGCAVGWGAFVMPGTVFLPIAGPLGVAIGMSLGAVVMLIIGFNYHYMMNHCPDAGGTYSYAKRTMGYDHGFLSAWFLLLVFIAITWANATALPLVFQKLLGDTFQVGFHYTVAGYDVYFGEVLLSLSALWGFGLICIYGGKLVARLQTLMALILFGGILICFGAALSEYGTAVFQISPPFAPEKNPALAILGIMVLAPWAFAGFESISNSAEEFAFSPKKSFAIMLAAVIAGALAYILLATLAALATPKAYGAWPTYLEELDNLSGLAALPTFHAAYLLMGTPGLLVLGITIIAGVVTGLVGNTIGASRLLYAMARDNMFPEWLGKLSDKGTPKNIILLLMLISLPIPFFGRTAISWIVDVNTIGVTIAYAYTSLIAFQGARNEGNRTVQVTGFLGCGISLFFFLYFMLPGFWSVETLSTQSYLILIVWSILGFVFFRYIFQRDTERRFGKSTISWIALLFLIFFTSMLWLRQSTRDTAKIVLENLSNYYAAEMIDHQIFFDLTEKEDADYYLGTQLDIVSSSLTGHNVLQMTLVFITLFIMFNIYNLMMRREQRLEVQKTAAEQSNKAKTTFFFNMSHDIRTPMNAIIGYTALLRKEEGLSPLAKDYLDKIEASNQHLLDLINDILEMSRIENGKMELELTEANIVKSMEDVYDLFITQMNVKDIAYKVDTSQVTDRWVMCDTKQLNRVLLNLISNAYKFTPEKGSIFVTLRELEKEGDTASYELSVKDTGMGMSEEFAATVFDAYTRDRTVSNIQGTGLGMAITKSIVELMGGSIEVKTAQGKGTEFLIRFSLQCLSDSAQRDSAQRDSAGNEVVFEGMRILLAEDIEMNREIATMILSEFGFVVDTAENGKIAVEKISNAAPGDYKAILMDIQMPVMNGYDAARAIRALPDPLLSSIPIIAMTANAFSEDVQDAMDAGMNAHIAKPLDVNKMMETLAEILSKQSK